LGIGCAGTYPSREPWLHLSRYAHRRLAAAWGPAPRSTISLSTPALSDDDRAAILGGTAVRLLGIK
jgi:hypothetical protein